MKHYKIKLDLFKELSKLEEDICNGKTEEAATKIKQLDDFFGLIDGCWFSGKENSLVYASYKSLRQKYFAEQDTVGVFE